MALSTIVKRISKFGGDSRRISTTTKLGSRAADTLSTLSKKVKTIGRADSTAVKSVASDAASARKTFGTAINKEGQGLGAASKTAAARAVKGAGAGAMIAIPLAAGGYGVSKLGAAVGQVRQGFTGATPEDLEMSRLNVISDIVAKGGNPADYGFTEQNLPGRPEGSQAPTYIFGNEQPAAAMESPASIGSQISQVALVGGAVAGGLLIINALLKKKAK